MKWRVSKWEIKCLIGFCIFDFQAELSFHRGIIDFFMHPFHVSRHVHLLLGLVNAIGTLELRLFATFPLLMIT